MVLGLTLHKSRLHVKEGGFMDAKHNGHFAVSEKRSCM